MKSASDGTSSDYTLSALVGKNEDLFARAIALHCPPPARVVDPTFGNGNFWKKVPVEQYETRFSDLQNGTDACALPHETGWADLVVLDPPYAYNPAGTIKASISAPYNLNATRLLKTNNDVVALYRGMMQEAIRVTKPGGLVLVKCQDIIEAGRQRWNHIALYSYGVALGCYAVDLFVLVQATTPARRWDTQKHARRNHSFLWVFRTCDKRATILAREMSVLP